MRLTRLLRVPTGHIAVGQTEDGQAEFLSIGDYGKDVNLNQHKKVLHQEMVPLQEKWVITISTQYGCSMGCQFCDVPKVGRGKNIKFKDMVSEIKLAMELHPEVKFSERLNIHFARMGEPSFNPDVLGVAYWLKSLEPKFKVHPVVSTMCPTGHKGLEMFIREWMHIKNEIYEGEAGLQLSINSTSERERIQMFDGNSKSLENISFMMSTMPKPKGRKITLNFAVAGYEIDADKLAMLFSPEHFIVKLTPMHKTTEALSNGIMTFGDYTESYPYEHHEEALRKAGFDVLVFIASKEEDLGRITCGNAILSGTVPLVPYTEIQV